MDFLVPERLKVETTTECISTTAVGELSDCWLADGFLYE